jgi:hypothetical protein
MTALQKFKPGDRVRFLRETGGGLVVSVTGTGLLTVEDEDGFPRELAARDCISEPNDRQAQMAYGQTDIAGASASEQAADAPKSKSSDAVQTDKGLPFIEVDLHIEKLVERPRGLSIHAKFEKQMDVFNMQMDLAVKQRVRRIIFIHGVGSGRLKEAISQEVYRHWPSCNCGSADPYKYGNGATEVFFRQ